jgi:hypothetical protein
MQPANLPICQSAPPKAAAKLIRQSAPPKAAAKLIFQSAPPKAAAKLIRNLHRRRQPRSESVICQSAIHTAKGSSEANPETTNLISIFSILPFKKISTIFT